jgi:C1A family cysteine protease
MPPSVSKNWKDLGVVTPVKNQGSNLLYSWMFAITGIIESAHKIRSGTLQSLSEQQLLDCVEAKETYCNDKLIRRVFEYVMSNGLEAESAYPYTSIKGVSHYNQSLVVATIGGYKQIHDLSFDSLKSHINVCPILVTINLYNDILTYTGGIYVSNRFNTSGSYIRRHAILIVGYDTNDNNPYYICKFSFGASFGHSGYVNISGKHNNIKRAWSVDI